MKPVFVLPHMTDDGPAHLGTWLSRRAVAIEWSNSEAGEPFPERIDGYGALPNIGGSVPPPGVCNALPP